MQEEEEYYEFTLDELKEIKEGIREEIFEIKQFIIGKAPIFKLYSSRIKRVEELSAIQKDLFPQDVISPKEQKPILPYEGNDLLSLFNVYFGNKNQLKQQFSASKSLDELSLLMNEMCQNEKTFACLFQLPEMEEGKIVSKELDPMDILQSVKEAAENGIRTLDDVQNKRNELPYILNGEIKRLLLLGRKF